MLREGLVEVFQTPVNRFSGGGSIASRYLQDRPAAIISPVCGRAPNVRQRWLTVCGHTAHRRLTSWAEAARRPMGHPGGAPGIITSRGRRLPGENMLRAWREFSAALLTAWEGPSDSPPLVDHLATGLGFHTVAKTPALALPGGGADSDFHRSAQSLATTLIEAEDYILPGATIQRTILPRPRMS